MALFLRNTLNNLLKIDILKDVRTYSRWSHRRPRRIIDTEEQNDDEKQLKKDTFKTESLQHSHKSSWIPNDIKSFLISEEQLINDNKVEEKLKKKKKEKLKINTPVAKGTVDMLETIIDADGNLVYTKLKNNDSTVSQLLVTVKSRRHQIKQDLALLEGKRLIKEALHAKCVLKNLLFSRKSDLEMLKPYLPKTGARLLKMPYREIQMWSDLSTTPGIMGIFKMPQVENYVSANSLPITIICDNIREPGNLGAILRTAAGVGIERILLTKGCVDLWDTKVLRTACGAHFHLQIHKKMEWREIEKHLETFKSAVFVADNKIISESVESRNLEVVDQTSLKEIVLSMPLLPYYSVQYSDYKSIALIVGGETEGVSIDSFQIASTFGGARLNIPLNSSVESLNVGTAVGIILFEIKRQMSKNKVDKSLYKAENI